MSYQTTVLRRQTEQFINMDPSFIELIPCTKQKQPGGGHKLLLGDPREMQTFKLIWQGGTINGRVRAEDGVDHQYDLILLGKHDCVMELNDFWIDSEGTKYIIEGFIPSSEYQRKAGIKAYGTKPDGG